MKRPEEIYAHYLCPIEPISTGLAARLSKRKVYGAILFDVYGTLLVSGAGEGGVCSEDPTGLSCIPEVLQRYDIAYSHRELKETLSQAIAADHRVREKQGICFPEVDILRIWQDILKFDDPSRVALFALEYELATNPVFPMPGASAVIRACVTNKIILGIISNAQFYTVWTLKQLFGDQLYSRGFDPGLRFFSWREQHAKPSEIMFRRAKDRLAAMAISPESVLYVGNDMLNDILPAAAVGFQTALFAGDQRSLRTREDDDRCRGVRPDLVVTDLQQLLPAAGVR